MGRADVIPGADFSGHGLPKIFAPIPAFGGALQGLWLFGAAWDGAEAAGDDWSGYNRKAAITGCDVGATAVTPTVSAWPVLPITPDDVIGDGDGLTVFCVATVPAGTVTTVPLLGASEGGAVPGLFLYALPGADTIRGFTDVSGTDSYVNYVYTAAKIEQQPAVYHCRWDNDAMTISPGVFEDGTLKYSSGAATTAVEGVGRMRVNRVGSGSMVPAHAVALYRGVLSDSQMGEVYLALKEIMAAKSITI